MIGLVVLAVVAAAASASPLAQGGRDVYIRDSSEEIRWRRAAAPTALGSGLIKSAFKPGTLPYNIVLDSPEDLVYILNQNNNPQTRSERVNTLTQVLNTGVADISLDDLHHYPGLRTAIVQGDGKLLVNHSGEVVYRPGPPKPAQKARTGVQVAKK
nr:uncharacterized protein LOC123746594 [Procambarus clarkii]